MNLSQLYYFSKLSELEHFSKAAKERYITQPSLSHAIKSLETELGVQLFEREGRRMRLTPFGKEFAIYVKRGLREIDKGVELAQEFNGKLGGTVNVGAVLTVQGDYLPPLFHDFSENYGQEVKLNMFQGFSIPLVEGLENDRYELAFTAYVPDKANLTFIPVLTQQLVAVVHRSDKLAWSKNLKLEDLRGREVITYPPNTPIGAEVAQLMKTHGITPYHTSANDEITLGSMVDSTAGTVGLALNTIGLSPFRELITKKLIQVDDDFHTVCLTFKTASYKTRAVENFIEFTRSFEWDSKR